MLPENEGDTRQQKDKNNLVSFLPNPFKFPNLSHSGGSAATATAAALAGIHTNTQDNEADDSAYDTTLKNHDISGLLQGRCGSNKRT